MIQQFHFWAYTQKKGKQDWDRYLYTYVQSCIIQNSQKVEATQVSTDRWLDKQNVVYT